MFQVEFEVMVSSEAHRVPVLLCRSIQLSFAPFPGLVLYGLMADRAEPFSVEAVSYDIQEGAFICELDDDQHTADEDNLDSGMTIADKLAEYGDDWQISEPGYDGM